METPEITDEEYVFGELVFLSKLAHCLCVGKVEKARELANARRQAAWLRLKTLLDRFVGGHNA